MKKVERGHLREREGRVIKKGVLPNEIIQSSSRDTLRGGVTE